MVVAGESHKDVGIRRSDGRRAAVAEINPAIRQAYVVDDGRDFSLSNLLPQPYLYPVPEVGSVFDAHSGRPPDMKVKGATVDGGKEIPSQPGHQNRQGGQTEDEKCHEKNATVMQTGIKQTAIVVAKPLECGFKP